MNQLNFFPDLVSEKTDVKSAVIFIADSAGTCQNIHFHTFEEYGERRFLHPVSVIENLTLLPFLSVFRFHRRALHLKKKAFIRKEILQQPERRRADTAAPGVRRIWQNIREAPCPLTPW